jgi:hypothetical protein
MMEKQWNDFYYRTKGSLLLFGLPPVSDQNALHERCLPAYHALGTRSGL